MTQGIQRKLGYSILRPNYKAFYFLNVASVDTLDVLLSSYPLLLSLRAFYFDKFGNTNHCMLGVVIEATVRYCKKPRCNRYTWLKSSGSLSTLPLLALLSYTIDLCAHHHSTHTASTCPRPSSFHLSGAKFIINIHIYIFLSLSQEPYQH